MLIINYGFTYFWDKLVLIKFINVWRMVSDWIWGLSYFYKSKPEEAKIGREPAIWPILCYWFSLNVVFTPPSSIPMGHSVHIFCSLNFEFYRRISSKGTTTMLFELFSLTIVSFFFKINPFIFIHSIIDMRFGIHL